MSHIRMRVQVHNKTDQRLQLDPSSGFNHGDWTDPWQPPATIAPGATAEFRSEGATISGEVPTTGIDGFVRYNIGGDKTQQLHIHWDSPLVESQYDNTFHIFAPLGFEAAHWGGQGHEASLTVRLQRTVRRRVLNFVPSVCAFHFSNHWSHDLPAMTVGFLWNRLLDALGGEAAGLLGIARVDDGWLPLTHADSGLCGGMSYATKDLFQVHRLPPTDRQAPTSVDDELFRHIRDRQFDSFDVSGHGIRWLAYSSPHYPNGDEGFIQTVGLTRGRSWVTYREEWPRIRDDIERGELSPIGLVQTDSLDIGKNHQVLGYAYQQSGQLVDLWIYDPNKPNTDDVVFRFDITDTAGEVRVTRLVGGQEEGGAARIFCMFRMDGYSSRSCPRSRPPDAMTLSDAMQRVIEHRLGRFSADVPGLPRPVSTRSWFRSL
jgi:hypothetical protein